jgi:hypothetical protein
MSRQGGQITLLYVPPQNVRRYRLPRRVDYLIHRLPYGLELLGIWIWAR